MEIWKDIKNYEDKYEISSQGRVRNKKTKYILKPYHNKVNGYLTYRLSKGNENRFYAHRLVAENFIDNPLQKKYVNHKDGDKTNNTLENLEWVTPRENNLHAYKIGLKDRYNKKRKIGKSHNESKLYRQYDLNGNFIAEYWGRGEIKRANPQWHLNNLYLHFKGKTSHAYGYKFEVIEREEALAMS